MYDQNDRPRSVFSLSIPGVLVGVFFTIIGCYVFGMGISMSADQAAGNPVLMDPLIPFALGIFFIFAAIMFTTGIVSYFGATVIRPALVAREQQRSNEYARAEFEAHIDDDDNPEYQ